MACLLCSVLWLGCSFADSPADGGSFLSQPAFCLDHTLRAPSVPYQPQPGDIMLTADESSFWGPMHSLAGSGFPDHSGIFFALPDGRMAILEAGPHNSIRCMAALWHSHLLSYEQEGRVWIRRRAVPLTPDQSARLTEFALKQCGKPFAIIRIAGQLTPLRSRGPIRTLFMGKPHGERRSYFCSELVMEACVAAGLLDPKTARPAATYPRDLFLDRSLNPYLNRHLKLAPCWDPPARWTSWPIP
jgi:hypothetical protein